MLEAISNQALFRASCDQYKRKYPPPLHKPNDENKDSRMPTNVVETIGTFLLMFLPAIQE
jgi:hypothetical protein